MRWTDRLGLDGLLDRPFQSLSSGQRQRVNLVRALQHEPIVLLLDEPTRSLDPGTSRVVIDLARERADAGVLVLVSSHELSGIEPHCDDIVLLDAGRVAAAGSRETVLPRAEHPTWRLRFHGSAARDAAVARFDEMKPGEEADMAVLDDGVDEERLAALLVRRDIELAAVERRDRPSVSAMLRALPEQPAERPIDPTPETSHDAEARPAARPLRAVRAIVRRDRLIHLTFKFRLLVQVTLICVWAALYHYVAQLIRTDDPEVAAALRGNPFGFLLIGLVGLQLSQVSLIQPAHALREEQVAGTLEPLLASGRNPLLLVLGALVWPLSIAIVLVLGMFAFTATALDAGFRLDAALPALVAAALGCAAFSALGLMSAAFVLAFKRGDPVGGVLNMASLILAGAYFPRELLPDGAQAAAALLPHTHFLHALRTSLIDGEGFGTPAFDASLASLALSAAVFAAAAVGTWTVAMRYARRAGTLANA